MPSCDGGDCTLVFASERDAHREIADHHVIRSQRFLYEERDFDDAIVTDQSVRSEEVWPDGGFAIEDGSIFGKIAINRAWAGAVSESSRRST